MVQQNKTILATIISIVGVILIILFASLIIGSITESPQFACENATSETDETFLVENTKTLNGTPVTLTAQVYNNTWLDFDGVDNYVLSERYDTISFWYKNSTVDWTFIVNSSGTLYVNGVVGTPDIFPVYDNSTNMFLGKTGASTFFNGSIDDFRGYDSSIDSVLANLTYLGGRL